MFKQDHLLFDFSQGIPCWFIKKRRLVLDACAAPGGKFTALLETEAADTKIFAMEINSERIKKIQENCERLGVVPEQLYEVLQKLGDEVEWKLIEVSGLVDEA